MPSVIFVNTGIYRAERRVDSRIHENDELTDWGCLNSSGYGHASKPNTFWLFRILYADFTGLNEFSELSALSHSPKMFAMNIYIQYPVEPLDRMRM